MNNIFLIGFMGAGKSTIARTLRDVHGLRIIEMDEEIEAQQGKPISQIFADEGEAYFRALETEFLERLTEAENTVVSCGGGAAMREENVAAMKKSGKIVYLSATPESIYDRVKDAHNRPLLEGNMNVDYIRSLMEVRLPKYEAAADAVVATDAWDAEEICRKILGNR